MKTVIHESKNGFYIELIPETKEDVVTLVNLAIQTKKGVDYNYYLSGSASISIKKEIAPQRDIEKKL